MDFDNQTDTISPDVSNLTITISGTGSLSIPAGTSGQRPSSSLAVGMIRWVSDVANGTVEVYTGATNTWKQLQYQSTNLDNLSAMSTNGFINRNGTTYTTRSLTAPAAGITISNNDGTAGNPTFALANDLGALEGLSGTGLAARTAADTWGTVTITGTSGRISVTNGNGVSGAPTIDLASGVASAGTYTSVTVDTYGRVTAGTNPQIVLPKAITILDVTSTEKIVWFFNPSSYALNEIRAVLIGSSTPTVTFSVRYGTDISAAGTEVVTGGMSATSTTTGSGFTSFTNATIPANNYVWITTSATTGTVSQMNITLR